MQELQTLWGGRNGDFEDWRTTQEDALTMASEREPDKGASEPATRAAAAARAKDANPFGRRPHPILALRWQPTILRHLAAQKTRVNRSILIIGGCRCGGRRSVRTTRAPLVRVCGPGWSRAACTL